MGPFVVRAVSREFNETYCDNESERVNETPF